MFRKRDEKRTDDREALLHFHEQRTDGQAARNGWADNLL